MNIRSISRFIVYKKEKKDAEASLIINWLGYLDSNQGYNRFRVCRLTAWLYPNRLRFYQALIKYIIRLILRQPII